MEQLERGISAPLPLFRLLRATRRDALRWQSALNLMYLVSAFPLGVFYFLFLVVFIPVGAGLSVVGVGIPLLMLTVACWWGFATFDRYLTIWWLDVDIAPMSIPADPGLSLWRRFLLLLRNPVTWTSLLYLMLKFPFGVLAFSLAISLFTLSAGLILSPLAYVLDNALYHTSDIYVSNFGLGIHVTGTIEPGPMLLLLLLAVLGSRLFLASVWALNGLAFAWGQFARVTLGMSATSRRLAEAREVARRERARAERADLSRRELIVNVSHELRTPIASILGHVESLRMSAEGTQGTQGTQGARLGPEEVDRYLAIVQRESERLSGLVDDLLALARADTHELRLDMRSIVAGEVVEEVYQALAPLAKREREITMVREVPPGLPAVLADRQRLAQVLLNLGRNAITYTPAGGIVSLAVGPGVPGTLAFTVSDTGIGIPADELESVFERFYRTDASRARSSGGSGLGLAIVRELVTAMGGSVSATSAPGEGSRFTVLLRVAPPNRGGKPYR